LGEKLNGEGEEHKEKQFQKSTIKFNNKNTIKNNTKNKEQ